MVVWYGWYFLLLKFCFWCGMENIEKKFSFKLLNWLRKDIIMNKLFYIGYILNIIFIVIIG